MNKHPFKSKLVWSGIIKILGGLALVIASFLSGEIDSQKLYGGITAAIWGIADIVLRFKTNQPLGFKK